MVKHAKTGQHLLFDEQYLRDFFENAPLGFHVFGADRKIIDINQAELDMIGYQRNEIINCKEWPDLIIEEQKPLFEKHWEEINGKGSATNYHYTLVHKDGRHVEVLLNASARFDREGKLMNTRGSVIDITKELQNEIFSFSRPEEDLIEQKKMLEQKNLVLNQLLLRVEMEKNKLKNNIDSSIEGLTVPLINKLRRKGSPIDKRHLDLLERTLRSITSEFGEKIINPKLQLSAREIEICNMVKDGLGTREIADLLSTSVRTVDNHRNHIRKKLGISGKNIDLEDYLRQYYV